MIAETLLSRLEKVRQTGEASWVACCPAHADKSPSLSISEKDESVILYCFAGCPTDHVLGAVGLTFSDLYPRSREVYDKKNKRQYFPARTVLQSLAHELTFASLCADHMARGEKLTEVDRGRLTDSFHKFQAAKELIG